MKQIIICMILLFQVQYLSPQEEEAERIITLFIENYPNEKTSYIDFQSSEFCDMIGCSNLNLSPNFGIFSTYMGYLSMSDEIGQISFPRKTVKESINILVAPKVYPIFMFQNTVAYWEIPENTAAKMYKFDKKQDEDTGLYYWDVREKSIGPKRRVPLHTIVIFTDPKYLYVPQGVTVSTNNPQLILPTIFAKRDPKYIQNTLFILTIKPFFSKINKLFNERPLGYAMHITD